MEGESITAATQRFYDAVARRNPDLAFLNYGFADPSASAGDMTPGEVADASRRLYDAVLTGCEAGGRWLEVGCGRGGGAAFVLESRQVDEYLGLDLSNEHVRMCRDRFNGRAHAHVAVADARSLPVAGAHFDVVFSVEAAQHFEDRGAFYRDVARALKPGGRFHLASIWRRAEVDSPDTFEAAGLRVVDHVDITPNVVSSLAQSAGLRRQIVESLALPDRYTALLMSWAGVRGHEAFEGLASGVLAYERFVLARA